MKIIVTGATGFIGVPLVRRLLDAGHEVTALSRDPQRASRLLPVRCEVRQWGPLGAVAPEVLRGVDVVVHLAGEGVADGPWKPARKRAIRSSRVDGARSLVQAMAALPRAERPRALVSASAIGFYGDRGDTALDEASASGVGFLPEVCVAWEAEARRAERLDMRVAVVRVGIVLGSRGGALARMLPPFRLGAGGRLGSGRQWMSWIHLDDMVELFAFAVENEQARGVLNGVAPEPVTNRQFSAALARALGRPALLPVPAFVLRVALGEMATILLASQRVQPLATEQLGFRFGYAAIDEALANLCGDHSREIIAEQWIDRPVDEVFPFFSDPFNLEAITPDFLHFQVERMNTAEIGEGTLIDYRLRLRGIPLRWQSRIESWEPGVRFVDTQVRGPYKLWHHTHEFEAHKGGTIIRDRVRYEVPLGALGDLVAGALVTRDVEAIFDYRRERIEEIMGATAAKRQGHSEQGRRRRAAGSHGPR